MRLYSDQGRRYAAEAAYHRCHAALEELGLPGSPALEAAHALALPRASAGPVLVPVGAERVQEELRLVSVLFAELSVPSGSLVGPEELQEIRSGALAGLISHVEAFGGTLTSVSGAGMEAVFGAPVSHEDDPERAVRAAYRVQSDPRTANGRTSVRIGVESGPAVVGLTPVGYAAVGEAVGTAAFLASVAKDASVLVARPPEPLPRLPSSGDRTQNCRAALQSPSWRVTWGAPRPGERPPRAGASWRGRLLWWAGSQSWRCWRRS